MRIGENSGSLSDLSAYRDKQLAKIQEKLSTGKKLNRASDDAAAIAVASTMESFLRGYQNANQNVEASQSAMDIADGGEASITDMLQRQRDLSLQSQNGTLSGDQRQAINSEYQQISQEIERTAQATQYNGQGLLNGKGPLANGQGKVQAGPGGEGGVDIPSTDVTLSGLGLMGQGVDTETGAKNSLNAIDAALRKMNASRADNGAFRNRMESAYAVNSNNEVNTAKGLSQIQDLDMAEGLTDKVRESLLSDSNRAAMAQFNQFSKNHLLALLQG